MVLTTATGVSFKIDPAIGPSLIGKNLSFDGRYIRVYSSDWKAWDYLHRIVIGIRTKGKALVVDHINRDRLDNRAENLRIVPQAINAINSSQRETISGEHGVHFCRDKKKRPWRAEIKKDGKRFYLGHFSEKAEARTAYLSKRKELFNE